MELLFIFLPLLIAVLVGLLSRQRLLIEITSGVAIGLAFIATILIAQNVAAFDSYSPWPIFSVDALGAIVMLIIACVGLMASIYSIPYLRQESAKGIIGFTRVRQYFNLLNLFLAVMFFAVTASNPVMTWIAIELTTLSTAFLISFYNKASSIEGAWKYLIINSVGLLLAFFGTLLYLTSLGINSDSTFATWSALLTNAHNLDPLIAKLAFIFVFIGYGVKVGLAPMHTWLPDAHSKSPAPISALLSGVLLNVAFFTVLKFKIITDVSVGGTFSSTILISFGLLSIFIAAMIILVQKSYKRLLAYSSIENMGIMSLGFGFGGFGGFGAILHMLYHSFIKSALFLLSGNFLLKYSSAKIKNVRGALLVMPLASVLFLVGIFAIAGVPPFGIFLTKLFIISAGMSTYPIVSIVAVILFSVAFVGLFKHAGAMIFGEPSAEMKKEKENIWLILPSLVLLLTIFFLSFQLPNFLSVLINEAVKGY
ncbi:MAG: proton-conducting transporter membrane subunit [Patescibacteria group bacterium]